MKLIHIGVRNMIGARDIDVGLTTPITVFAGPNGAGKSSLAEAVRMALAGEVERVALKKEFAQLVHDGADTGEVAVTTGDGDTFGMTLPSGKGVAMQDMPALPFVLDPGRFARLSADERRTFLFGLAGVATDRKDVEQRLINRGAAPAKVAQVLPLVRAGFPEAAKFAADQARDAKAAWRAVTGETYGEKKAESWRASAPQVDGAQAARLDAELAEVEGGISAAQTEVGALQEREAQSRAASERAALAGRLPALRARLDRNLAEAESLGAKVKAAQERAGSGPRIGVVHDLATAVHRMLSIDGVRQAAGEAAGEAESALAQYEREHGAIGGAPDPEAVEFLSRARDALALMTRAIANDRRDIAAAEVAQAALDGAPEFDASALEGARERLANLQRRRTQVMDDLGRLRAAERAAEQAETKTQQAAQHHADVQAWALIAGALSPDGIPGELLEQALGPINDRLRDSSKATDWMRPEIGPDMTITANGRPYRLLSASERWRVDAMIGEAISHLSGTRLLILDAADVLQTSARADLIRWLSGAANAGELDTAIVCMTLRSAPTGLPGNVGAYWIDGGRIAPTATEQS